MYIPKVLCQVLAIPIVPAPPPNMENQEVAKWPPWKVNEKPLDIDLWWRVVM